MLSLVRGMLRIHDHVSFGVSGVRIPYGLLEPYHLRDPYLSAHRRRRNLLDLLPSRKEGAPEGKVGSGPGNHHRIIYSNNEFRGRVPTGRIGRRTLRKVSEVGTNT